VIVVFEWFVLIYWLRIVKSLSIYVILVFRTIQDIKWFFTLFLICVFMFANAIYILNASRNKLKNGDAALYPTAFGNDFVDAILDEYRVAFAADHFEVYTDEQKVPAGRIVWAYYIFATFLTQITFMNMLINLMGVTFARVTEEEERLNWKWRTEFYTDWLWLSLT